jgi:hypothetical protein
MSVNSSAADPSFPFAGLWTGYLEQADAQSKAMLECFQSLGDPEKMQRQFLDSLSTGLDSYMRSPAFLEGLQRNLRAMTDMKAVQDQVVQDVARHIGIPLASDIYGLFERLYSVEHTIIARLKAIEGRLASIETALEDRPDPTETKHTATPTKPAATPTKRARRALKSSNS